MAQITQGFSYTTSGANSYVTASNLNQHVSLAQLAGGAVVEQTPNSSSNNTDKILIGTGSGGSAAVWSQTKLQFTESITSNTINVTNLNATNCLGFAPVGGIIMWSGTAGEFLLIPSNWKLCDGTNGTPDLRNRFVVGAGINFTMGETGGNFNYTLSENNIPEHDHQFRTRQVDQVEIYGSSVMTLYDTAPNWPDTAHATRDTSPWGNFEPQPISTTPPFYALAYIMRIS